MSAKLYQSIGLGGTFDHLHLGHETFIKFASQFANFLLIGVTDDKMVMKKVYPQSIQPFEVRKNAVINFCHQNQIKCKVTKLTDPYGPTLDDQSVQAIAVTNDTVLGAKKINELRQKLNLKPLTIHVCSLVKDEYGEIITSSRIRAGLINRQGFRYDQIFNTPIVISDQQKKFFSQLQGNIVATNEAESFFNAVVGDRSLKLFLDQNWPVQIGVYDLKEKRTANPDLSRLITQPDFMVTNTQGEISLDLVKALKQALIQPKKFVLINGEDDLAAVALILILPLEAAIYYGQPNQGMVEMIVTEHKKNQFFEILSNNKPQPFP